MEELDYESDNWRDKMKAYTNIWNAMKYQKVSKSGCERCGNKDVFDLIILPDLIIICSRCK